MGMRSEGRSLIAPGFPERFFGMVTLVTLCAQSDGTSVVASVRPLSFTTPTRRAEE